MRIILAGGAGFIGTVLANQLLDDGYEVTVIDTFWFGDHLRPGVARVKRNLFECSETDFAGAACVVVLGGLSNDPMAEFSPAMNFQYNAALPGFVGYLAKRAGVPRVVYASSCSVYGYSCDRLYDEDAPVRCGYPYGIAKYQGERGLFMLQDQSFSVIALRAGTVCGYSPRMRFDLIINAMYRSAMTSGEITVNNPAIWRPIIDIRDIASAYKRAIQADPGLSGTFNVALDNFTVGQVAELVRNELQPLAAREIRLRILQKQDFRNYKVSTARARTELGFHPFYSLREMVSSIHAHHGEYGDLSADAYANIAVWRRIAAGL